MLRGKQCRGVSGLLKIYVSQSTNILCLANLQFNFLRKPFEIRKFLHVCVSVLSGKIPNSLTGWCVLYFLSGFFIAAGLSNCLTHASISDSVWIFFCFTIYTLIVDCCIMLQHIWSNVFSIASWSILSLAADISVVGRSKMSNGLRQLWKWLKSYQWIHRIKPQIGTSKIEIFNLTVTKKKDFATDNWAAKVGSGCFLC